MKLTTLTPKPFKLDLRRVTLVCIEGRHPDLALYSLSRCMNQADFATVLLFGSAAAQVPEGIRLIPIDGQIRSVEAYSEFVIRRLPDYIDSDYVLIVQWDSFILDTAAWRDEFFAYDYLGAPWDNRSVAAGNGGFSLRSRVLLKAVQALPMAQFHPEDLCIAEFSRDVLEREHGMRFPSHEIAQRFAFERTHDAEASFGFHGFFNFHLVMDRGELGAYLAMCPPAILCSRDGKELAKHLIREKRLAEALCILRVRFRKGDAGVRMSAIKYLLIALIERLRR